MEISRLSPSSKLIYVNKKFASPSYKNESCMVVRTIPATKKVEVGGQGLKTWDPIWKIN
jgi:hypothetical protein